MIEFRVFSLNCRSWLNEPSRIPYFQSAFGLDTQTRSAVITNTVAHRQLIQPVTNEGKHGWICEVVGEGWDLKQFLGSAGQILKAIGIAPGKYTEKSEITANYEGLCLHE